ncbi:MAG TPA: PAS domain-containing protein [Candidatus Aquilonibacter sp.]|nr:PAS domain-containing protein [Candidatus Aquilonibacter sp.]
MNADEVFAGPGELRALYRKIDWASTSLGPVETWPRPLTAAVQMALAMPQPARVFAGAECINIYNEAHIPLLHGRHPAALARPAREAFAHAWDRLEPVLARCFAGQPYLFIDEEVAMLTASGSFVTAWFTGVWSPIRNDDGAVCGIYASAIETTGGVLALRSSESRLRTVLDLAPALLWETNANGNVVSFNSRWLEYTGQTLQATQSGGWRDAVHPDDRAAAERAFARAFATGVPLEFEYRVRRADGVYRWFLVRHVPVETQNGEIVRWIGTATDIHDQRMALDYIEQLVEKRTAERDALSNELLQVEEAERSRLARELHDEASQQLTALDLGLHALTKIEHAGDQVREQAHALRKIVKSLAQELHAVAGRLRPRSLDDFGLEAALSAAATDYGIHSGVDISVCMQTGRDRLPSHLENTIYRVVQEALTNVVRHSGASSASVIVERDGKHVNVAIQDNGTGFDVAEAVEAARRAGRYGLTSIRERVTLLAGQTLIDSRPGSGTTVKLRIPMELPGNRRSID